MKLRNGKEYTIPDIVSNIVSTNILNSKPIINIDKYDRCCICMKTYTSGELICSCSINNINKHSFHKTCIHAAMNASLTPYSSYIIQRIASHQPKRRCPYCLSIIKTLDYIKIMFYKRIIV